MAKREYKFSPERQALLDYWVSIGIAVADAGDGMWAWNMPVVKANPMLDMARMWMSNLLYGTEIKEWMYGDMLRAGFGRNGYRLGEQPKKED